MRALPKSPFSALFHCLFGAVLLCGQVPLRADEFSKTLHYSARMFSFGTLTINTRMGDVQVEGWDEPRLEIDAEKVVEAKDEKHAQPLYDRVQVVLDGKRQTGSAAHPLSRAPAVAAIPGRVEAHRELSYPYAF